MQLLPNQSILFWSGGWVKKPNEKRVENTAVFENPCMKRFQTRMKIFLICILQQKHVAINNLIVSITKFSIVIGSPHAYLLRNRARDHVGVRLQVSDLKKFKSESSNWIPTWFSRQSRAL